MAKDIGDISRYDMAKAGLSAAFAITAEWNLSNEELRVLLGNPSRSRFDELRRGKSGTIHSLSVDELDRLAYITGIYAMLNMLYSPASHPEWLRNASKLPSEALYRPWGAGSPLGYMLTGKLKAVADVYDYMSAECNGM